jgi:DNA-binding PadR family transcriptional regulator
MSRNDGPGDRATPLAHERKQILGALDGDALTGPDVFRRVRQRSVRADAAAAGPAKPGDQSLLYPALHSLEAGWTIQATWQSDAGGANHRTYRRRRLLPRRPAWTVRT